jgi:tetratricopeptide (TPR) repeat protein
LDLVIGIIASLIAALLAWCVSIIWKKYYPKEIIVEKTELIKETDLPSINNIPYHRNPNFTGREKYLDDLEKALKSGQPAALTQAIHGLGGIGKTQIALEYCYRHKDDYKIICWLRSESTITLSSDYAALAEKLNFPEKDLREQDKKVEAVKRYLEGNGGWLLVFDNAENQEDLLGYIPKTSCGHIIITSRSREWDIAAHVKVEIMERASESIEFILKRTSVGAGSKPDKKDRAGLEPAPTGYLNATSDDRESADRLAKALGDLPLAMEQACAYINKTGQSINGYLGLFEKEHTALLKKGKKPVGYPDTVMTTWLISFNKLMKESPASIDILNLCAFLDSDNIPIYIMKDGAEYLPKSLSAIVKDDLKFDDAIGNLRSYSLIERKHVGAQRAVSEGYQPVAPTDDNVTQNDSLPLRRLTVPVNQPPSDRLSVHRLFQFQIQNCMTKKEIKRWVKIALMIVNNSFCNVSNSSAAYDACELLLPHALMIVGYSEKKILALKVTVELLRKIGLFLNDISLYEKSKQVFERSLKLDEIVYGKDHLNLVDNLKSLGSVLKDLGNLHEARNYFERALAIGNKVYSNIHLEFIESLDNSASLSYVGRFVKNASKDYSPRGGGKHCKGTFKTCRKAQCPRYLNKILKLRRGGGTGYPIHAFKKFGISLKEAGLEGEPDMDVLLERSQKMVSLLMSPILTNLGDVLKDLGEFGNAKKHFENALQINEKVYGKYHPSVVSDLINLGLVFEKMGDKDNAKYNYERAYKICLDVFGENHPSTITARDNLDTL